MTDAELSAYNTGARAARAGRHEVLLAALDKARPAWAMTREELRATLSMPRELVCRWVIRGYTEETDRMGEADRQPGEEEP